MWFSKQSAPAQAPADKLLTYRFDGKLVYVRRANNYEKAIDYAFEAFPHELADVEPDQLTLSVNSTLENTKLLVAISADAWETLTAGLNQYELIEVRSRPKVGEKGEGMVRKEEVGVLSPPAYGPSAPDSVFRMGEGGCSLVRSKGITPSK